jgi:hypothetical protein
VFRCCSDDVVERMTASDRNIAMDIWFADVSFFSDNLKTQTMYCWANKKYKIGFREEFPEDGGT